MSEQVDPTPNASRPVWELVIDDMQARDHAGRAKYGTPLQAHNGRDQLRDAYEEALDLAVYLRAAMIERDRLVADLASARQVCDSLAARCAGQSEVLSRRAERKDGIPCPLIVSG